LKLAANTKKGKIAYGVVAGVMAVVYTLAVLLKPKGKRRQKRERYAGQAFRCCCWK